MKIYDRSDEIMKIMLFGKHGQVGWELQRTLAPLGKVYALDKEDLDLANIPGLNKCLHDYHPDLIVNASAYTAVDRAEIEQELAFAINGLAPGVMAEAANRMGAGLIHFSTDYVFDGDHSQPYTEQDVPNPINAYGRSKLAGEQAIQQAGEAYLIFRTSWVYSLRGDNFVSKVLGWARKNTSLRIVEDQFSNPTWARLLAEVVAQVISKAGTECVKYFHRNRGLYHLAGTGFASRYDWAMEILANDPRQGEQIVDRLEPARTEEFPTPAQRPLFTALDCTRFERTFGLWLPPWQDALRLAMVEDRNPI